MKLSNWSFFIKLKIQEADLKLVPVITVYLKAKALNLYNPQSA